MEEKRMSQVMIVLGYILALIDYKALAVFFWMAGVAWKSDFYGRTYD